MFKPLVAIVDFHHTRGPEIEQWINIEQGQDPAGVDADQWSIIPFLSLPDGAHSTDEAISYFTLRHTPPTGPPTSVFGISCTHQIDVRNLKSPSPDIKRSSVQKAVVAIVSSPFLLSAIRERLRAATSAWFSQCDFGDISILEDLQENLVTTAADDKQEKEAFIGLSLRDILHDYKWQVLTLFKCLLLQKKMLIFGTDCERLCLLQFTLISLIPGLITHLEDCAGPELDGYVQSLKKPTSLKSSERGSLLTYMGLPLTLFSQGSLFSPYTCLQQMDSLTSTTVSSYLVGSTNGLFNRQKDRYSDILIDLDEHKLSISSPELQAALALTAADRRWIDGLVKSVNDTWDEEHPSRPTTMGYIGSEEFIRSQFEEYLLALIASVKYKIHLEQHPPNPGDEMTILPDTSTDYSSVFISLWRTTPSFMTLHQNTEADLYNVIEPRHPCAGGLSVEDIQRRLTQQITDLQLDEKFKAGREGVLAGIAAGQRSLSSAWSKVSSDIEVLRDNQRKRAEAKRGVVGTETPQQSVHEEKSGAAGISQRGGGETAEGNNRFSVMQIKSPDLNAAQASVSAAGAKAGAYFSSWGNWASEKGKTAWAARGGAGPGGAAGQTKTVEAQEMQLKQARATHMWSQSVDEDEQGNHEKR